MAATSRGSNPAIRAVTIRALREGCQVIGILRGLAGLVDMVRGEETTTIAENFQTLSEDLVNRAGRTGGTFCTLLQPQSQPGEEVERSGSPAVRL